MAKDNRSDRAGESDYLYPVFFRHYRLAERYEHTTPLGTQNFDTLTNSTKACAFLTQI